MNPDSSQPEPAISHNSEVRHCSQEKCIHQAKGRSPHHRTKKPKMPGKEKKPTVAGNLVGRKKMATAPVSRETKAKTKYSHSSSSKTDVNLVNVWCWSPLHSRWSKWIWCPLSHWLSFSRVWGRDGAAPSQFFSRWVGLSDLRPKPNRKFTFGKKKKKTPKDCCSSLSMARESEKKTSRLS